MGGIRRALRSRNRPLIGRLALLIVMAAACAFLLSHPGRLDAADKLANVGLLVLGALTFLLSLSPVHTGDRAERPDVLVAGDLARLVQRQWSREAAVRLIRRPDPLAVPWSLASPDRVGVGRVARSRGPALAVAPAVDVTDLAALFQALPDRRLMVLGAAGSGKTVAALLLALDLLATRRPDGPVPVLLSLSSWRPDEHVDTWLARRLAEDYPTLAGGGALARLVRTGLILPVLDGLDELPPARRTAVVAAFNTDLAGRPAVLTCRSDAYADPIADAGTSVDRAVVVELRPLESAAVAAYLPGDQIESVHRWAPVVAGLRDQPDGPLARVLSTPLMAYLARTAYSAPATVPDELLDAARFPDPASIQEHLLERYLPAVYAPAATPLDPDLAHTAPRRYPLASVQGWLRFLAAGPPGSELAWWRLPRRVPRWRPVAAAITGTAAAIAGGLAAGVSTALVAGPGWGLVAALAAGLWSGPLCAWAYSADRSTAPTPQPRQVRVRLRTLVALSRTSLVRGAQCALVVGFQAGTFIGIAMTLRHNLATGITDGAVVLALAGLPAGVVEFLAQNLISSTSDIHETTARTSLAGDRTATMLHVGAGVAIFGPLFGLAVGAVTDPLRGLVAGLTSAACAAVGSAIITGMPPERMPGGGLRWIPYQIARIWLAIHGRIPLRLQRFLDDAHARGVLHQVGAVYQFRHTRVREHLAISRRTAP